MTYAALALWSALLVAAGPVTPSPTLGKAEAACRPKETGPALIVHVVGLKDRKGLVRAEVYPANDADFLRDDAILINQGKTFRRVALALPPSGHITSFIRVPSAGSRKRYAWGQSVSV